MNASPLTPDELRGILAQLHLTQDAAASLLGVTSTTVYRWCSGRAPCQGPAAILLRLMVEARRSIKDDVRATLRAHMETIQ